MVNQHKKEIFIRCLLEHIDQTGIEKYTITELASSPMFIQKLKKHGLGSVKAIHVGPFLKDHPNFKISDNAIDVSGKPIKEFVYTPIL